MDTGYRIPDKGERGQGTMVFRGIYDHNWYLHETKCNLYREIRQRDRQFPLLLNTGLKDKNAKQIYKGDIIQQKFQPNINIKKFVFDKGQISWMADSASFGIIWEDGDITENLTNIKELTIIGNIYENPELVEEKK